MRSGPAHLRPSVNEKLAPDKKDFPSVLSFSWLTENNCHDTNVVIGTSENALAVRMRTSEI